MIGNKLAGMKKHKAAIDNANVLVKELGFLWDKGTSQIGQIDTLADERFLQFKQRDTLAFLSVSMMICLPDLPCVKTAAEHQSKYQ